MSSQYNTISKISLRNRQYQRIRLVTQGKFLPRCTTTGPNSTETCVTTVELRELTILTTHCRQAQCDCRLTLTWHKHTITNNHPLLHKTVSFSGTTKFQNLIDPAKRNYLLDTLASAWEDQQAGLGEGSKRQQSGNFDRWRRFLDACGIYDEFLDNFTIEQRIAILSAYAASVRRNDFGKQHKRRLAGSTVKASITHVCSTFRSNL